MAEAGMKAGDEFRLIYSPEAVEDIAARVAAQCPSFDRAAFVAEVCADLPPLALKARSRRIAEGLWTYLPADYPTVLPILLQSMGEPHPEGGLEGFGGFRYLPFLNYVGLYGQDYPELSLDALERMTLHFSAEFDIRFFVLRHPAMTMERILEWAQHPDWRVRRLSSEGIRPRLPWAQRLPGFVRDPAPVIEILDLLHDDPNLTVRRSVANNLNDIAKDHPDRAVETGARWMKSGGEGSRWTVGHGMRTLVKQGHPGALELLGFAGGSQLRVEGLSLSRDAVRLGEGFSFTFSVTSSEAEPVRLSIDYAVHHRKANGKLVPKVFKLAKRVITPGETIRLERFHAIVPLTTRRYYSGLHRLEILINGRSMGNQSFELEAGVAPAVPTSERLTEN